MRASASAVCQSSSGRRDESERTRQAQHGAERVAQRGAGLEAARNGDRREAVGSGALGDLAAGRDHDDARAARLGLGVAAQRLLGPARVAGRDHERALVHEARQRVVADDRETEPATRRSTSVRTRSPPMAEPPMPTSTTDRIEARSNAASPGDSKKRSRSSVASARDQPTSR